MLLDPWMSPSVQSRGDQIWHAVFRLVHRVEVQSDGDGDSTNSNEDQDSVVSSYKPSKHEWHTL